MAVVIPQPTALPSRPECCLDQSSFPWGLVALVLILATTFSVGAEPLTAAGGSPSHLVSVVLRPARAGVTVIELEFDAPFEPYSYRHYQIKGAEPREVLRVKGVSNNYARQTVAVNDGTVLRLRFGLHDEQTPPELHIVFDLANENVRIRSLEQHGATLVVTLAAPGGFVAPRNRATAPPWQTATPGRPTPTPTMPPRPTVTPTQSRPVPPPPTATATVTPSPRATPTKEAMTVEPLKIVEIATSRRPDGSTLVRITATTDIGPAAIRHFRLFGSPPRYVVGIAAAIAVDLPTTIMVRDRCLNDVSLVGGVNGAELQLVLELTDASVAVAQVAHQGRHVVVELTTPAE